MGHFPSITGNSRLIIPVRPHSHLACFVRDGSYQEFKDMILAIHEIVRSAVIQILTTCRRNHQVYLNRKSHGGLHLIGLKYTLSFLSLITKGIGRQTPFATGHDTLDTK